MLMSMALYGMGYIYALIGYSQILVPLTGLFTLAALVALILFLVKSKPSGVWKVFTIAGLAYTVWSLSNVARSLLALQAYYNI